MAEPCIDRRPVAAQQNLLRVNDIIHEVEKQLDGLKRQAGRARRYNVLSGEMKAVEQVYHELLARERPQRAYA